MRFYIIRSTDFIFFHVEPKIFPVWLCLSAVFALNISCFITQCDSSMDITRCLMLSLWILLWVKYASRWWKRLLWSFFTIVLDQVHDFKSKSNFQWLQCFKWMLWSNVFRTDVIKQCIYNGCYKAMRVWIKNYLK